MARVSAPLRFENVFPSASATAPLASARRLLRRNNWFSAVLGGVQQSSEQGVGLQTILGGGIGRYLKNTNRANISLAVGPAFVNTRYNHAVVPVNTQRIAAAIVSGQAQFFKFSKTNLDIDGTVLPARIGAVFTSRLTPITSRSSAT